MSPVRRISVCPRHRPHSPRLPPHSPRPPPRRPPLRVPSQPNRSLLLRLLPRPPLPSPRHNPQTGGWNPLTGFCPPSTTSPGAPSPAPTTRFESLSKTVSSPRVLKSTAQPASVSPVSPSFSPPMRGISGSLSKVRRTAPPCAGSRPSAITTRLACAAPWPPRK